MIGLVAWTFFSGTVASAANSVVGNQSLVTKVYFPRLIIPISAAGVAVVDLLVSLGLIAVMMLWYEAAPGWSAVFLPAVLLLLATAALGFGSYCQL